jgi:hypothetical protein
MLRSALVLLALACATSAHAKDFDYDYFQLTYGNVEFDDVNVDGDNFGLSGSYALNEDFHVFAGYESAGLDFGIDATTLPRALSGAECFLKTPPRAGFFSVCDAWSSIAMIVTDDCRCWSEASLSAR